MADKRSIQNTRRVVTKEKILRGEKLYGNFLVVVLSVFPSSCFIIKLSEVSLQIFSSVNGKTIINKIF